MAANAIPAPPPGYENYSAVPPPPPGFENYTPVEQGTGKQQPKTWLDEVTNTVGHWWNQVNPLAAGNSIVNAVQHPIQAVQSMGRSMDAPRVAAEEAFKKGDYAGGVRHALNYALNAIPGAGSTLDTAGNEMEQGDISGGLGDTAGLATNLLAPKIVPAVTRGAGKVASAVKTLATDPEILPNAGELATGVISPHAGVAAYARRQVGRIGTPKSAAVPKPAQAASAPPVPLEEVKPFQFGPDDLATVPDPDLIKPLPPKPPVFPGGSASPVWRPAPPPPPEPPPTPGPSPTWSYSTTTPPIPAKPTRVAATTVKKVNGAPALPAAPAPEANAAPVPSTPPTAAAPPVSSPPVPPPSAAIPAAKLNIMTEPKFKEFATSNGLSEADATELVKQQGYEVMPRGKLNQLVHNFGVGHGALSDIASMKFGVKSMKDLTDEQMLQMAQDMAETTATGVTGSGIKPPVQAPVSIQAPTTTPQTSGAKAALPAMARGGIVHPRMNVRAKGTRPQISPRLPNQMPPPPMMPSPAPAVIPPMPMDQRQMMPPEPMAKGGVISPAELVRGSADVPMAPDGLRQTDTMGKQFAKRGGIHQIVAGPLTRTRQTAALLQKHNPAAQMNINPNLSAWHLGGLEGQPRDKVKPIIENFIHKQPAAVPPGRAPISTGPGESFNTYTKVRLFPLLARQMQQFLQHPNQIIVDVMHRGGVNAVHGWAAKGFPSDFSVDPKQVTQEREYEPVYRLAPGKGGKFSLAPVDMNSSGRNKPGIYLMAHGVTAFNKKNPHESRGAEIRTAMPPMPMPPPIPQMPMQPNV